MQQVLIVDDDFEIRETLGQILEDEGYAVAGAANGMEALSFLRADNHPCVILLDLMMPVMNGWQFATEQKRDPGLAKIPVVVISAVGDAEQKARTLGAVEVLRKPIDLDQLLATVGRYCGPGEGGKQ